MYKLKDYPKWWEYYIQLPLSPPKTKKENNLQIQGGKHGQFNNKKC